MTNPSPKNGNSAGPFSLFRLFLWLGLTAFGGPAAHIAIFRDEFVAQRGWLSEGEFARLLAISQLLPGPTSTELALHIGKRMAGARGLAAAGAGFILPAVILTIVAAWFWPQARPVGLLGGAMSGLQAAVVGLLLSVSIDVLRPLKSTSLWIALLAAIGFALHVPELILLVAGGLAMASASWLPAALAVAGGTLATVPAINLTSVASGFARIGATLLGSGYVLYAYMDTAFVKTGMLRADQLADAVAIGQLTPGPLFSAAAFAGYAMAGMPGAWVAACAIFAPAFLFTAFADPIVRKIESRPAWLAALNGAGVASLGLLAGETVTLGARLNGVLLYSVAIVAVAALQSRRVAFPLVLAGGAALGALLA